MNFDDSIAWHYDPEDTVDPNSAEAITDQAAKLGARIRIARKAYKRRNCGAEIAVGSRYYDRRDRLRRGVALRLCSAVCLVTDNDEHKEWTR